MFLKCLFISTIQISLRKLHLNLRLTDDTLIYEKITTSTCKHIQNMYLIFLYSSKKTFKNN